MKYQYSRYGLNMDGSILVEKKRLEWNFIDRVYNFWVGYDGTSGISFLL